MGADADKDGMPLTPAQTLLRTAVFHSNGKPWTPPAHRDPEWLRVLQGTSRWLSEQEWHTFATLTYPHNVSGPAARRAVERWLPKSNVKLAWWVTERGDKFGRIHNHALLQFGRDDGLFGQLAADTAEADWRRRHGHTAFRKYDPARGACGYLASYVLKKVVDYDLWLPSHN